MINNQLWIIYTLVFGAALLGVQALYWLVVRSRDAASPAVTAFIHQARAWAKAHGYGRESCTQG